MTDGQIFQLIAWLLFILGVFLTTAMGLARYLGRLVHWGWLLLAAAMIWLVSQFYLDTTGYGKLGVMVMFAYYVAPAALGWGLGSALGLRRRRRAGLPRA